MFSLCSLWVGGKIETQNRISGLEIGSGFCLGFYLCQANQR